MNYFCLGFNTKLIKVFCRKTFLGEFFYQYFAKLKKFAYTVFCNFKIFNISKF